MSQIKMSTLVSSITVNGNVLAVAGGLATIVAADLALVIPEQTQPRPSKTTIATGNVDIWVPPGITSVTLNGNVYAAASNILSSVPAADATSFIENGISLVTS